MTDGLLNEVLTMSVGSETSAAVASGATAVPVENPTDFGDDGGRVEIAGVVYDYSGANLDTGVLTLTQPLTAAIPEHEPVWVLVGDKPAVNYYATVDLDDDTGETVWVPLNTREERLAWPVRTYEPPLPVTLTPDLSAIIEARGVTPQIDGALIDATTVPDKVAADPPASSPAVTTVGMPDTIMLRTEAIASTTLVTFQISTDGGATWQNLNSTPIRSTLYVAKGLPGGGAFVVGTVYKFRTLASNDAGSAPASAAVDGQVDTSAVALVASQLITERVIAGFGLLGSIQVGGDTFTLTPPGVDPENLAGGLRIELTNGGLIHLPADGSPATFSGVVLADYLEVNNGASLRGASDLRGTLDLGSTIADPTAAPTVVRFYESKWCPVVARGLCRNEAGTRWVVVDPDELRLVEFNDSGTITDTEPTPAGWSPAGVTRIGPTYYVLLHRKIGSISGEWGVAKYDATLTPVGTPALLTSAFSLNNDEGAIGSDGTNLLTAVKDQATGEVELLRTDPVTLAPVGSAVKFAAAGEEQIPGGIYYGSADLGTVRWVYHPRALDVQVRSITSPYARQSAEEWPRPAGMNVRGMWWDGTYFWVVDLAGVIRRLEPAADAPAATYYWSYSWVDSDTHTTLVSPVTAHTRPKRARIRVTASAAPQETASGTHIANRVNIFASTTSGGTKYQQGATLAAGTRAGEFTAVATTGNTAPTANNWAAVAPVGKVSATTGGASIDGNSNGSIGTGTFRDSVDARVTALAPPRRPTQNNQTGTTYTLVLTDEGKVIQVNNAGAHTLTVPDDASVAFIVGTQLEIARIGAGAVTIAAAAGVTIQSRGGLLSINGQYGLVRLRKRGANLWILTGDLA